MIIGFKENFITLWKRFFGNEELPITFYYTNEEGLAELAKPGSVPRCIIAALQLVRDGRALSFDSASIGCPGGRRYLGFSQTEMPNLAYFLSCGIPGKLEGERYKKTTEIAAEAIKLAPPFKAPARFIVFKRWDSLAALDEPDVVVFFASPDVLSGLFTLANFDQAEANAVFSPFGSGCSTIVHYPLLEKDSARPRAVLGQFDVSGRPFIPRDKLSFAMPMAKFKSMVGNMEESFMTTNSWKAIQQRIQGSNSVDA